MNLLLMLIIPTIVALGFLIFSKHKVTLKEFAIQMGIQGVLMAAILSISSYSQMYDVEIHNGAITAKKRVKVTCSHEYCCYRGQCCSGSGKNRSCYSCCKRYCKRHSFDVDWRVYTNINETFNISRLSSQGLEEPPRWTKVKIGEPYSSSHSYDNYIKANPDSLFNRQGLVKKFQKVLPKYPGKIYDYHRIDRLVTVGVKVDKKVWNLAISEANKTIGPKKFSNIVVVLVNQPKEYFHALQQHWIGGKKNDVIVVISTADGVKADWVEVMAWTKNFMVQTVIKDSILKQKTLDPQLTVDNIEKGVYNHYIRKPMKEFEYLKDNIKVSTTTWIVSMIIGLISSIGLGIYFLRNEYTDNGYEWRR